MAATDLRYALYDLLEQTDDIEILSAILALLRKSAIPGASKIVGYEASGSSITEDELVISILESSREMRQGNSISFASMKRELGL